MIKKIDEVEIALFRTELKILCSVIGRAKLAKGIPKTELLQEARAEIASFFESLIKKELLNFTNSTLDIENYQHNLDLIVKYIEENFSDKLSQIGNNRTRKLSKDERHRSYRTLILRCSEELKKFYLKSGQLNLHFLAAALIATLKIHNVEHREQLTVF